MSLKPNALLAKEANDQADLEMNYPPSDNGPSTDALIAVQLARMEIVWALRNIVYNHRAMSCETCGHLRNLADKLERAALESP